MEKDIAEALSSGLADPGSSCDPEMVEGDWSTINQSPSISDVSQKDKLFSDQQHETETDDDRITTNMGKQDDKSVASNVVTSMVSPQAKQPGAIPKKHTCQLPQSPDSEDVQQTPMTAETFSNILTVGDLEESDSSHEPLPVPTYSNERCIQDMFVTCDQVASGIVTSMVNPQAKHPGAIPKKCTSQLPQSPDSEDVQQTPMPQETFSNILTVGDLEESDSSHEPLPVQTWPPWSLPPPERDKKSEDKSANSDQHVDNESCTIALVEESAQSRTLTKKLASDSHLLTPENNILKISETFSKQNEAPNAEIIKQICLKGQDTTVQSSASLSPHPTTCTPEEGGNSSCNASSLVTRPQLLGTSATVVTCGSRSAEENLNSQQSRNPAEHDDEVGNDGLLQALKKEIEMLRLNESFLVQELRAQTQELRTKSVQNMDLKQQLEANRTENAELLTQNGALQQENEELRDRLHDRETLIAANLETIQMIQELLHWKTEECDRLKERVRLPIPEEDD